MGSSPTGRPPASLDAPGPTERQVVHLLIDKTATRRKDAPWTGVAATKVTEDYVSKLPDISSETETIFNAPGPSMTDFHERCEGSSEVIGLLFSEMAKHPLPPQVSDRLLGLDGPLVSPWPQKVSAGGAWQND